MEFIAHRVNTVKELKQLPLECGVEIDLRDYKDQLVLQHDPFCDGDLFEEYLKHYRHGTIILNIKSERVEPRVLELLSRYPDIQYFFLDSSIPVMQKMINEGERNFAVRFSELESLETVLNFRQKVKWVWVDCFTVNPLTVEVFQRLKKEGFKICFVSPELLGRPEDVPVYAADLRQKGIALDAVCAKPAYHKVWVG